MKLLTKTDFCVAIVDLSLVNEDGMTLVAEIAHRRPQTKIIIHTANASFESALEGLELGIFAYVEKLRGIAFLVDQVRRAASAHLLDSLNAVKRESQVQIRMLDAVHVGAIATNDEFEILYLNSISRKIFDFSEANALGLDALKLFARIDDSESVWLTEMRSLLKNLEQDSKWEGDVQLSASSGSQLSQDPQQPSTTFRLTISPIVDSPETGRGYIFVFSDISEQRRAEQELESSRQTLNHAQRIATIGQIANALAHEINQPLGAISNYAGGMILGLKQGGLALDTLVESLGRIQEHAIRAGEIIGRLRTYISRRRGLIQVFDMNLLIHESLRLIEPVLREHRVHVDLALSRTPMLVEGDRVQLSQVLVNVLKNAAEAIDSVPTENRVCCVVTSCSETEVQVCIHDHGPGLEQREIEFLFEPGVSQKEGGMGLGLCISRSIMEEHRGSIVIEKGASGGLVVHLRLPAIAMPVSDQQTIP